MPEVLTVSRVRAMSWVNLDVLILSFKCKPLLCCDLLCFPVLSLNRDPGTFRGFWGGSPELASHGAGGLSRTQSLNMYCLLCMYSVVVLQFHTNEH